MKILLISLYDEWCLGVRSLSAVLKREGHEVTVGLLHSMPEMHGKLAVDDPEGYHNDPSSVPGRDFAATLELVRRTQPELIGISYTSNFFGLAEIVTAKIRAISSAPIIWGGVDVTANPDLCIKSADIVCRGEGEGAIVDLTRRLAEKQDYTDIPNLWVRRGEQVFKNEIRPLIQDLDNIPFCDFEPEGKYWITAGELRHGATPTGSHLETNFPIMATRGCPYACTFCCNAMYRDIYGNKDYVRLRSVRHTIDEIVAFLKRNPQINSVEFWDDVFGTRQEWVREFSEAYSREVGLPFWCYTYPAFCRPELVENLKKAGVSFLVMGVQTGSQRTLKEIYNRNSPQRRVIEAAKMIMDGGIPLIIDLIGSNPLETEEDRMATLELLLEMPPGFVMQEVNPLTFYRNYPITDQAEAAGHLQPMLHGRNATLAEEKTDYRFWNALHALTQFPAMEKDALRAMAKDMYLREHPEIVESILRGMVEATYIPGTRMLRRTHEEQLAGEVKKLHGQLGAAGSQLDRVRGSRAVQWYFKLKQAVLGGANPFAPNGHGNGHGNGNGKGAEDASGSNGAAHSPAASGPANGHDHHGNGPVPGTQHSGGKKAHTMASTTAFTR